jgi:thymidylate synthase/nicotinamide riboside kinase
MNAPTKTLKLALTGSHGTGKTTLISAIAEKLAEKKVSFELVREIPRVVCESVDDDRFFRQDANTFAKQTLLLQGQMQAELAAGLDSPELILCDRALLDHWIYTAHFHRSGLAEQKILDVYVSTIAQHCQTYDLIFYLPIEFVAVDDGVREADLEFQKAIDRDIRSFLEKHGFKFITVTGTVAVRCATVIDCIEKEIRLRHSRRWQARSALLSEATGTRIGLARHVPDAEAAYRNVLANVLATDHEVVGGETKSVGSKKFSKEILHYELIIGNPRERLIWNPKGKFYLPLAVVRFVWMMAGNDRLKDIEFYTKGVSKFSDDGIIVPGSSYGRRMMYPTTGCNQIASAVSRLREDAATRRAAVSVFWPEDVSRVSSDIPCMFGLAFHNRGDFLHPSVVMRSNNAFSLLPFNIFEFSLLGEAVAAEIGLKLGAMSYYALSMHVYARDYANAHDIVAANSPAQTTSVPIMPSNPSPLAQIRELVKIEAEVRHAAAGFSVQNFESKWLPFADSRLDPYWRQFYYVLLFAMCHSVDFPSGASHLIEFIDEPWLSFLPLQREKAGTVSPPAAQVDLFPELGTKTASTSDRRSVPVFPIGVRDKATTPGQRADSSVFSRAEFEHELEQLLELYRPQVAKDQWSRVVEYQPIFLQTASASPEKLAKVFQRLQNLRFSLEPGEKVESQRAKAEVIIRRLEQLTAE